MMVGLGTVLRVVVGVVLLGLFALRMVASTLLYDISGDIYEVTVSSTTPVAFRHVTEEVFCGTSAGSAGSAGPAVSDGPGCGRTGFSEDIIDNRVEVDAMFTNGEHVCSVALVLATLGSEVGETMLSSHVEGDKDQIWHRGHRVRVRTIVELPPGTRVFVVDPEIEIVPRVNQALNAFFGPASAAVWGPYVPIMHLDNLGAACKVRVDLASAEDVEIFPLQEFATLHRIVDWAERSRNSFLAVCCFAFLADFVWSWWLK
jgi:hypothetical protein